MAVEGQRLAVALDGAADRTHLAAARQRAAQRLKRDLAAPAARAIRARAARRHRVPPAPIGNANAGASDQLVEPYFALDGFFIAQHQTRRVRATASPQWCRRDHRSSICCRASETRDDSATFCTSVSDGLRSSSGARSALRILRLTFALTSFAHGSAEPSASASSPLPVIFAFSRSGARQAPLTEPSNCIGPSAAATARSSPSSVSRE